MVSKKEEKTEVIEVIRSLEPLTNFDNSFKIIVVGDTGVGKTCVIKRTEHNKFDDFHTVTLGGDFAKLYYMIKQKKVKVQLWDTCGLEQYRSMIKIFFKGANASIIVFDITNEKTYYSVQRWFADVRENTPPSTLVYLVGNKSDLPGRPVPKEAIDSYIASTGIKGFFEVSARTGQGLEEMFNSIMADIFRKDEQEALATLPDAEKPVKIKESSGKTGGKKKCC